MTLDPCTHGQCKLYFVGYLNKKVTGHWVGACEGYPEGVRDRYKGGGKCDDIMFYKYFKFSNVVFKKLTILSTTTLNLASINI